MTSKEALNEICKECNKTSDCDKKYGACPYFNKIWEDLEVLEIYKKLEKTNYIYREDGLAFGFIGINFNDECKLILYNEDKQDMFTSDLKLSDYKKTWWLKGDK